MVGSYSYALAIEMGERRHAAPWRKAVVDIRFGLLKRMAREFFLDLGVPIPERDLLAMMLEFYAVTLTSRPVPEVRVVIQKHQKIMELINTLMREGTLSYSVITQAGNSKRPHR
jgi:hypothetical protein